MKGISLGVGGYIAERTSIEVVYYLGPDWRGGSYYAA
jgi:hypothetical protein